MWNPYGKVDKILHDDNSFIKFVYDANQNRVLKSEVDANGNFVKANYYIRDAAGNVLSVYSTTSNVNFDWEEAHLYGSSRIGLYRPELGVIDSPLPHALENGRLYTGKKSYEFTNHLGNVLLTLSDRKKEIINASSGFIDRFEPLIKSSNDYYPFGLQIAERTNSINSSGEYRYGFNGKEKDTDGEWGSNTHYDYGFRIYNPAIAKFLSVDPLTRDYPDFTPYQFAGNTPIVALDLDGLEILEIHSAFWSDRLLEADLHLMNDDAIKKEVSRINSKGYKNSNSEQHARDYYESNGEVVSLVSTEGPLKLKGYTNANNGDVIKFTLYSVGYGGLKDRVRPPSKKPAADIAIDIVLGNTPFGKFGRAVHIENDGFDKFTGEKGNSRALILDGAMDLVTLGTSAPAAVTGIGLTVLNEVVSNLQPEQAEELGIAKEVIEAGLSFQTGKGLVQAVETAANLVQAGILTQEMVDDHNSNKKKVPNP